MIKNYSEQKLIGRKNKVMSINLTFTRSSKMISRFTVMLLLFGFLITSCQLEEVNIKEIKINTSWKFKSIEDTIWQKATVPGCVHSDLIANGIIDDPFYRLNEHDVQWIDKKDWEYKTIFFVDKEILEKDIVEIDFEGLDTYANVFMNDSLILKTDNMFISWKVNCKNKLNIGENSLRIVLESPIKIGLEKRKALNFTFPDNGNDLSEIGGLGNKKLGLFTRKAGYHFGWDWGPRLVTSGIWKDIVLTAWDRTKLSSLDIIQESLDNEEAILTSIIEIESHIKSKVKVIAYLESERIYKKELTVNRGNNHFEIPFRISNPKLWWTNGLGEQKLYKFSLVLDDSISQLDSRKLSIGLRTVEIVQEADSVGKSFSLHLNGHPIFMKGANYIPQDVFLDRVTDKDYERVIKSAVDANFNMLRVWGGGIYEKDIFYDLCDKYGILVWQDFMFACSMYPGDDNFLKSVETEAKQNVNRLKNHPSIALWCGNNEILSAWNNWGWKDKILEEYGEEIADSIWNSYEKIFHNVLPNVVKELDPKRLYWASSPQNGNRNTEDYKSGDMHYWGVWWGKEPFENFRNKIPRFMSEFGFQSFPEMKTVEKYTTVEDHDIYSDVMKSHQRSSIGNETIEEYLKRDYNSPKNFEMFLYVGQLLQARGISSGIRAQRQNMPYCMGSLYWQINDCWPVASWSSTDYYGNWKALHYSVKDVFEEIIISTDTTNTNLDLYIISDKLSDIKAKLLINVMDFNGESKRQFEKSVVIQSNKSKIYFSKSLEDIKQKLNLKNSLVSIKLFDINNELITQYNHYFCTPKYFRLPKPKIEFRITEESKNTFLIELSSDKLSKNVYLSCIQDGFFSNNFFDILPNNKVQIKFESEQQIDPDSLHKKINIVSLIDTY